MPGTLRNGYGDIGLELSLTELHMVQLCRHGEGLRVSAHASVPYDGDLAALLADHGRFAKLVRKGFKQARFAGRRVVAAMPASYTQVKPVSYQSAGRDGDAAAIARLMHERLGDVISEFVIDYMPVQTLYEGREKLALVAICREETVVSFLDMLHKARLTVTALEIGPIAIQRLITALQRLRPPQNTLVVNCGREKSYLTLLSDSRLLSDDEVDFGEDLIVQRVCSALHMSPEIALELLQQINLDPARSPTDLKTERNAEALTEIIKPQLAKLVAEIQRGLMFAQSESRGTRTDQVYLLGSIARWPGTARLLSSLTGTPVSTLPDPLALFSDETDGEHPPAPALAVASGLALRRFMGNE